MQDIEIILKTAKADQWPYPKTFEMLKKAGVTSYTIHFSSQYDATFLGEFGVWKEVAPSGYIPLQATKEFSGDGVKAALGRHIKNQTTYVQLLAELAQAGASQYKVDMDKRTVTYSNDEGTQSYQQHVPEWSE